MERIRLRSKEKQLREQEALLEANEELKVLEAHHEMAMGVPLSDHGFAGSHFYLCRACHGRGCSQCDNLGYIYNDGDGWTHQDDF